MKRFGMLTALFLVAVPAWAVGPIQSPQQCGVQWIAPTKNTDGSPLTDLAKYNIYLSPVPDSFPATPFTSVPSPTPGPGANTTVTWDCKAAGVSEGQHYLTVRAVDIAANEGGNAQVDPASGGTVADGIPFVFNALKPASATGLGIIP